MPDIMYFMLSRLALGAALGAVFVAALGLTGHPLNELIQRSGDQGLAVVLLTLGFCGTFGLGFLGTSLALEASGPDTPPQQPVRRRPCHRYPAPCIVRAR